MLTSDPAVLNPKGSVAEQQRSLMLVATLLMLIVVIPVFFMAFFFTWKYRESNTKATYEPEWDSSKIAESVWWGFPLAIILILSIITWTSTHALDPFKPLNSNTSPLRVQVVALQWKWLFIYPEQNIATVNYLQIPTDRPINFEITADAPMNSFWIPQLGGQIYAMAGMSTQLHLIADESGSYRGSSANLSGKGFSGMHFIAEAVTNERFNTWIEDTQLASTELNHSLYAELAKPSENEPPQLYTATDDSLYSSVMDRYVSPAHQMDSLKPNDSYDFHKEQGMHHD